MHADSPHRPGKLCQADQCIKTVEHDQSLFVARIKTLSR
jgi:hypothetical protein